MADNKEKRCVSDNAQLMAEWDWEKNNELNFNPDELTLGSHKKVWWRCSQGHEWQATIKNRNNGNGCPYCSSRLVLIGYNDLQTANPSLAKEWNFEKNNGLTPTDVLPNSNKKVWWRCNKGHEWQATINSRNKGVGCPICNSERKTSFPEYAIEYYLTKYGLDVIHSYKEHGYELDIYIPSRKTAIEYDGYFWHMNKTKKDLEKNLKCQKDGIILYRIREGLPPLNDSSIDYVVQKGQRDLSQMLQKVLFDITRMYVDVNLERDIVAIENLREHTEKEYSLMLSNPELTKEWDYIKNGNLRPEYVATNSGKKVWWKCSKGHEWQATIDSRNNGRGCPYCSGNKVLTGYNDLQTLNPVLAKEWNYEKNNGLTPKEVLPNSGKRVWWKCQRGHEWQATIDKRNKGKGCPYCSGRYAVKDENDLQTVNPTLAKEWNFEKNNGLTPIDVKPNSNKQVWWKCSKGHEWQATINSRNAGCDCPICSNKKILKGYNDLQTVNPSLAKEWNYEKNNGLTPAEVSPNSGKKVWWKCDKGHEWQATINSRNSGCECPYCSGRLVIKGENDLQSVNPALAKEWNYEKNMGLTPVDVKPNSDKKVWWKCSRGHEWQTRISHRNAGSGCPQCAREKCKKSK
ncbi:MAG: zinc-ribbon domain-containing protein [Oscillospiraceae bacterium]|nr:zinc-ribbon domain-containing protein [Oscillospiraceae bacterium]